MVVINLERPTSNLQAVLGAGTNIFRRVAEAQQKIERDKRIQELITGAREEGKEVTTTIGGKTGGITGVSIKDVLPPEPGFFDFGAPSGGAPATGTRAVSVPGAQTINLPQALAGGLPGIAGAGDVGQRITPSAALAPTPAPVPPPAPLATSTLAPFGGQLLGEELTAKRGAQTLKLKRQPTTAEIQADIAKGAAKAAAGEGAKAAEKAERGVLRASIASNTAFDEVVRFNRVQFKKFGVRPGDFLGLFDKLTPKQLNEHKAAAVGAGREAAATVGMQIIPAARAVRMVDIFAKSSAEIGNTIEGNANNVGASMGNAFGNALAANILIPMADGTNQKIQDVTIDKQTGRSLSQLPFAERLRAFNDITQDFRNKVASNYILNIFERDPELLQPEFRQELETSIEMEDAQGNKALVNPNTGDIILEL